MVYAITLSNIWSEEVSHTEARTLPQAHIASKWWSQDYTPRLSTSRSWLPFNHSPHLISSNCLLQLQPHSYLREDLPNVKFSWASLNNFPTSFPDPILQIAPYTLQFRATVHQWGNRKVKRISSTGSTSLPSPRDPLKGPVWLSSIGGDLHVVSILLESILSGVFAGVVAQHFTIWVLLYIFPLFKWGNWLREIK